MVDKRIAAFIVDDEVKAQDVLVRLLETHCPQVEVLGTARNIEEAGAGIKKWKPHLLFLDIDLAGESSFGLLQTGELPPVKVIFTTGHREHALKAFQYQAVHYLLKPIDPQELKEAVQRIGSDNKPPVSIPAPTPGPVERIALPDTHGYELIHTRDIIRLEADGSYTWVITKNGDRRMVSKPLGYFEESLNPPQFLRIHKKHLINIRELVKYSREKSPDITMSNGDQVTVSWRMRKKFFEVIDQTTGS